MSKRKWANVYPMATEKKPVKKTPVKKAPAKKKAMPKKAAEKKSPAKKKASPKKVVAKTKTVVEADKDITSNDYVVVHANDVKKKTLRERMLLWFTRR